MMDFILGILGLAQITFFPGAILHKFLRFHGNFIDKTLAIFGTSLIVNYCVVVVLSFLGIYTRIVLAILILAEVIAGLWLYRSHLNLAVRTGLNGVKGGIDQVIGLFFPKDGDASTLYYWIGLLLLALSAKSVIWAANLFYKNLGSVFSAWDAVVSWNHWAILWFRNRIPTDSRFYPQLIPANWSIPYVLLGSTTLQFFSKAIMPLFTLLMVVGLLNLSIKTKKYSFLVSLILLPSLLDTFLHGGLTSGYVDIAVAFFGFGALYFLLQARQAPDLEERSRRYILGCLFSAGAAITKQTGVYVALCYPILVCADLVLSKIPVEKKHIRMWIAVFVAISAIWVVWYGLKEIQIVTGVDRANIDVLLSKSAESSENASLPRQIVTAVGRYPQLVVLFVLIALVFPWMDRFYKVLAIIFAPYPLLWAWVASYDTRNLAIFLPILALLAGYAADILIHQLTTVGEKTKVWQMPVYIPIALGCAVLLGLNFIASPAKLLERQEYLQKQIFSPTKNQALYDLVARDGPQTRILTNYPMNYLPGLKQYQVHFDFEDYDLFLVNLQDPQVAYILIPNAADPKIKEYIDAKIKAGEYQLVFRDKEWKTFTLIKILHKG